MKPRRLFTPEKIQISRATIQSRNLIGILAWAAQYKMPYERALKTIVRHGMPFYVELVFELLKPFIWIANQILKVKHKRLMVFGIKPFFRSAVESAILDLQEGFSLSYVLETHLRWWLPEYYIQSIKLAEDKGCVDVTLIQLGETTSKIRKRRKEIVSLLLYPFVIVSCAIYISWLLGGRVLWKYRKIFDDLTNGMDFPYISTFFLDFVRWLDLDKPLAVIFLLQLPWLVYIFGLTHRGDWLLVKIPVIRKSILRWKMIDALQGLSMYSRMKIPLHESLDMVIDHQPSSILKSNLEKIRCDLLKGIDLKNSWLYHFPNDHLSNFYIKSGLEVDKFSDSLDLLVINLLEEDTRKHGILVKSIEPIAILLITFFVAFVVFAMFLPMIELIEFGVGWEN